LFHTPGVVWALTRNCLIRRRGGEREEEEEKKKKKGNFPEVLFL
jgi:hypothetical protein